VNNKHKKLSLPILFRQIRNKFALPSDFFLAAFHSDGSSCNLTGDFSNVSALKIVSEF